MPLDGLAEVEGFLALAAGFGVLTISKVQVLAEFGTRVPDNVTIRVPLMCQTQAMSATCQGYFCNSIMTLEP